MKIAIACDHRGFEAKRRLLPTLKKLGHEVQDFGCEGSGSVDYPDYGLPVSKDVAAGVYEVGILLDGSGIGGFAPRWSMMKSRPGAPANTIIATFSASAPICSVKIKSERSSRFS